MEVSSLNHDPEIMTKGESAVAILVDTAMEITPPNYDPDIMTEDDDEVPSTSETAALVSSVLNSAVNRERDVQVVPSTSATQNNFQVDGQQPSTSTNPFAMDPTAPRPPAPSPTAPNPSNVSDTSSANGDFFRYIPLAPSANQYEAPTEHRPTINSGRVVQQIELQEREQSEALYQQSRKFHDYMSWLYSMESEIKAFIRSDQFEPSAELIAYAKHPWSYNSLTLQRKCILTKLRYKVSCFIFIQHFLSFVNFLFMLSSSNFF